MTMGVSALMFTGATITEHLVLGPLMSTWKWGVCVPDRAHPWWHFATFFWFGTGSVIFCLHFCILNRGYHVLFFPCISCLLWHHLLQVGGTLRQWDLSPLTRKFLIRLCSISGLAFAESWARAPALWWPVHPSWVARSPISRMMPIFIKYTLSPIINTILVFF
jgi:hypothetical protein